MGNRLSRIYTRTGDDGSTGLGDGMRVPKEHLPVLMVTAEARRDDIVRANNGAFIGVAASIFVIFIWYILYSFGKSFGAAGTLDPAIARDFHGAAALECRWHHRTQLQQDRINAGQS